MTIVIFPSSHDLPVCNCYQNVGSHLDKFMSVGSFKNLWREDREAQKSFIGGSALRVLS